MAASFKYSNIMTLLEVSHKRDTEFYKCQQQITMAEGYCKGWYPGEYCDAFSS